MSLAQTISLLRKLEKMALPMAEGFNRSPKLILRRARYYIEAQVQQPSSPLHTTPRPGMKGVKTIFKLHHEEHYLPLRISSIWTSTIKIHKLNK